jgi:hypothetical protein
MNRIQIVPVLVAVALAVASCGGGSSNGNASNSTSSAGGNGNGQRPARPQLTDSQVACLKQQGVTPPGQGGGQPGGGAPGGGAPGGGAPGGGNGGGQLTDQQRQQFQQRRQKMTAAFEKCNIPVPQFGGGNGPGPGAGQPQNGGSSQ